MRAGLVEVLLDGRIQRGLRGYVRGMGEPRRGRGKREQYRNNSRRRSHAYVALPGGHCKCVADFAACLAPASCPNVQTVAAGRVANLWPRGTPRPRPDTLPTCVRSRKPGPARARRAYVERPTRCPAASMAPARAPPPRSTTRPCISRPPPAWCTPSLRRLLRRGRSIDLGCGTEPRSPRRPPPPVPRARSSASIATAGGGRSAMDLSRPGAPWRGRAGEQRACPGSGRARDRGGISPRRAGAWRCGTRLETASWGRGRGRPVLVLEPIARAVTPWWNETPRASSPPVGAPTNGSSTPPCRPRPRCSARRQDSIRARSRYGVCIWLG